MSHSNIFIVMKLSALTESRVLLYWRHYIHTSVYWN